MSARAGPPGSPLGGGYYVEPTAVGRELLDMPLFLDPEVYVNVPLEATYQGAYRGVPRLPVPVLGGGVLAKVPGVL